MERVHAVHGRRHSRQTTQRLFALLLLILGVPSAFGGELSLLLNGHAIHFDTPRGADYNENNLGLGLQYDFDPGVYWTRFATASGFKDSLRNMSYYVGGGVMHRVELGGPVDGLRGGFGVVGFFMTRKDVDNNHPFPGALPAFEIGTQRVSVNITYVPKVHPKFVPLLFLQVKVPFTTR